MEVGQIFRVAISGLDRHAQVYSDHVARVSQTNKPRVAAFAASAFEHDLVADEIRRDGRDPIQELFLVMLMNLIENQPLRAKLFSRAALNLVMLGVGERA